MREVEAHEADLRDLLAEVESGETVVILHDGKPVARLVPEESSTPSQDEPDVFERIRAFRKTMKGRVTIDEILAWRHEGHRY